VSRTYRVIQWGTGNVGHESVKSILMHPRLELVGVKVYTAEKEGVDAGSLCGMPDTGIRATQDAEALLATEADCVVYMPRLVDLDDVCALLRSGKNVVCTPFLFFAEALPEADREKVRTNLASIHRYNLKLDLSAHANPQRPSFAVGKEGGLLL